MSKARISAAVVLAVMGMLGAAIDREEGNSNQSYEDVVGVWTVCGGVTHGIKSGMTFTKQECAELTKATSEQFLFDVVNLVTVSMTAPQLLAHTTFAYNIGINGYKKSRTLRLTNAGDAAAGCRAMLGWYTAGGKDCRIRSNNCYGVINRRNREVKECLAGLK